MANRVLKAGSAATDAQTEYNFIDLRQRCDNYVDSIRIRCRTWVNEAQEEAAEIRQAAYDAGRRDGLKDGLADAATQIEQQAITRSDAAIAETLATALPALQQAAAAVQQDRERWRRQWETDAAQLALAVAERLTRATLAVDADALAARMTEVLSLAAGSGRVTVSLPPRDLDAVGELAARLPEVDFQADASLQPGDCVARTREGEVDARVTTQLEQIERELIG